MFISFKDIYDAWSAHDCKHEGQFWC